MAEHDIVIDELIGANSRWNFHYREINQLLDKYLQASTSIMAFVTQADSIVNRGIENKALLKQFDAMPFERDQLTSNRLEQKQIYMKNSTISPVQEITFTHLSPNRD